MLKAFFLGLLVVLPVALATLQSDHCKDPKHPVLRCDCVHLDVKVEDHNWSCSDECNLSEILFCCQKSARCNNGICLSTECVQLYAANNGTVTDIQVNIKTTGDANIDSEKPIISSSLPVSVKSPASTVDLEPSPTPALASLPTITVGSSKTEALKPSSTVLLSESEPTASHGTAKLPTSGGMPLPELTPELLSSALASLAASPHTTLKDFGTATELIGKIGRGASRKAPPSTKTIVTHLHLRTNTPNFESEL